MNLLTSRKSWLLAPVVFVLCLMGLLAVWMSLSPEDCRSFFDHDGHSPFELMTLPLFALIIPLSWLACPVGGSLRRQCGWSALYSVLGFMALVREQDWHKMLFAQIWPEITQSFAGTVFKMRFLRDAQIPLMPKLFVLLFFIAFFLAVLLPLVRYAVPLFRGFFRLEPVAWTVATFGGCGVAVLFFDRLPANLRNMDVVVSDSARALFTTLEEGGEMMLAIFALLAILQSHLIFARKG